MPGGPKLERPIIELEMAVPFVAWQPIGTKYLLLFELSLTNRGEESIVKDWEICILQDSKPVVFPPAALPSQGITLMNGEKITNETLLTETAVRASIPHGHRVVGWVAFSIPREVAQGSIQERELLSGSIRFEDYLAHTYSYDFKLTPNAGDTYVPGKAARQP
jgi:hypothetical protein